MEGMQQKVTKLTNRNEELMATSDHQTVQITTLQEHLKVRLTPGNDFIFFKYFVLVQSTDHSVYNGEKRLKMGRKIAELF